MGEAKRRSAWQASGGDWGPQRRACSPRHPVRPGLTAEELQKLEDERTDRRNKDKLERAGCSMRIHKVSKHHNPPRRTQARG